MISVESIFPNHEMLQQLKTAQPWEAACVFLIANFVIFFCSILFCWGLGVAFSRKRIFDRWEPLRPLELVTAVVAVILNAAISVAGWCLWSNDAIILRPSTVLGSLADGAIMVLVMDFGMYVFHRIAHAPLLYRWMHRFHHRHEVTNPVSLFVLHPVEVVGFGSLMIGFLVFYPITLAGLIGYLSLNVIFGSLGHSGVEPFPAAIRKFPILRLIGTSTFHAEHHEHPCYNFGFYTLIWDKLFGTLDPDYDLRFRGERIDSGARSR